MTDRRSEPGRENDRSDRFLDHPDVDLALSARATTQHAIVALEQLRELGLGPRGSQLRVTRGRLYRIHRAVYSIAPRELLRREGLWLAAVYACGADAALSHRSAAALHELRAAGGALIDVTVACRSARRHAGVRVHRSTTLTPADLTTVNAIPTTTVARTLLDLACVLPRRAVERACDQAEVLELFDLTAIEHQLARHPTANGTRTLRSHPARARDRPDPDLE